MSPFFQHLSHVLFLIFQHAFVQLCCFFGLLFVSGIFLTWISRWTSNTFQQFRFPRLGLYLFGIIGVPLHEFCHALFAKLFLHDIQSIKWFDPKAKGGSYGTVVHTYNERNPYHRVGLFFIGMGPVLLAPFLLLAMYHLLIPAPISLALLKASPAVLAKDFSRSFTIAQNFKSLGFYFFIYLALCMTSQMELSPDDFKIARGGILPFFLILLVTNGLAFLLNLNLHAGLVHLFNTWFILWATCVGVAVAIALVNLLCCTVVLNLLNFLFGKDPINPFKGMS